MTIQIVQKRSVATEKNIKGAHFLCVLSDATSKTFPFIKELDRKLKRTHKKMSSLTKEPVTIEVQDGRLLSFVVLDKKNNTFQRHTLIRKALKPLIAENPEVLNIAVFGDEDSKEINARAAVYVALMNSQRLPSYKKESTKKNIRSIEVIWY
jgi:leucyl aminopeptidase